jgi:hypothetical protein
MARVQTNEVMGNMMFDPGIAQSVLTNKEMQSRERTAMAQMATQNQISAGDQAASMSNARTQASASTSNARTQANASMFNTTQGIAGESNMQSQRLAAQAGAQASQQSFEKWMQMQQADLAGGLQKDRLSTEVYMQKMMQENEETKDEKRFIRNAAIIKMDRESAKQGAIATAKMKMNMYKWMVQNGSSKELMDIHQRSIADGEMYTKDLGEITRSVVSSVDEESPLVKGILDAAWTNPSNGGSISESDDRVIIGKAKEIAGFMLKNSGLSQMGITVDDLSSGKGVLSTKIIQKVKDPTNPMQEIELARLDRAFQEIEKTLDGTKNKSLQKVREWAMRSQLDISSASFGDDPVVKKFVMEARNRAGGEDFETTAYQHMMKGGDLKGLDTILSQFAEEMGIGFAPGGQNDSMYKTAESEFDRQAGELVGSSGSVGTPLDRSWVDEARLGTPEDKERKRMAMRQSMMER